MEFYKILIVWIDGREETKVLTVLDWDDAVIIAKDMIEDSMDNSYAKYGDDYEDAIDEICFWNEDEDDAFAAVTERGLTIYDDVPFAFAKTENE